MRRKYYKKSQAVIDAIYNVLDTVDGAVSTRQIYYQLISIGVISPTAAGYNKAQRLILRMRKLGDIPPEKICDRTRSKHQAPSWNGLVDIMETVQEQYRRDYWSEQDTAIYIAVEKRALEGIFQQVCDEYGVGLFPLGGYASYSLHYDWAMEILKLNRWGKDVKIYYFGDFDPSGMNIDENVVCQTLEHGAQFTFERVGILPEDIEKFNLMTLPVKRSDTRAKAFIDKYGTECVELDALQPNELKRRIRLVIEQNIDPDKWDRVRAIEREERISLDKFVEHIRGNGGIAVDTTLQ